MFDYKHGLSSSKLNWSFLDLVPRLSPSVCSRGHSLVLQFLTGLEVVQVGRISKAWYVASNDSWVWRELCQSLQPDNSKGLAESEELLQKFLQNKKIELPEEVASLVIYKNTYLNLFLKTCCMCKEKGKQMKFLPLAKQTLCISCVKLPDFQMISHLTAEIEYGVTKKDINDRQLEGIKVPHSKKSGKFMYMFYLYDILNIRSGKGQLIHAPLNEKKKTELIYYLKKEGISDNHEIEAIVNAEGNLAQSFIQGKSKTSVSKVAKRIARHCEDKPAKKQKTVNYDAEERKMLLIDRLECMGIDASRVNFDDPNSLASKFVSGKLKRGVGPVAGEIWRDLKPVFTGIHEKTTQRLEDINN